MTGRAGTSAATARPPQPPPSEARNARNCAEKENIRENAAFAEPGPSKAPRLASEQLPASSKVASGGSWSREPSAGYSNAAGGIELAADWTIKTHATFFSKEPFEIARRLRGYMVSAASAEACHPPEQPPDAPAQHGEAGRHLQRALAYWAFPASPLPNLGKNAWPSSDAGMLQALGRTAVDPGAAAIAERVRQWQDAFFDAVAHVFSGHCDALYVLGRPWAALFLSWRAAGGNGRVAALVSRTSRGQRAYFRNRGFAQYRSLTDEADEEGPVSAAVERERQTAMEHLQQYAAEVPGATRVAAHREGRILQGPGGPALLYEGFDAVQGIRDALLMMKPTGSDVPQLLAGSPFANGALKFCQLKSSGASRRLTTRGEGSYVLEVAGPILPHTLTSLLSLLRENQPAGFTGTFRTEPATVRLSSPRAPPPRPGQKRKTEAPPARVARSPAFDRAPESDKAMARVVCAGGRLQREDSE